MALLLTTVGAQAATENLHVNAATVNLTDANPPIDARAFVNLSGFAINFTTTNLYKPYWEILNLVNFTNYGDMLAYPGFRIWNRTNGTATPKACAQIENHGNILTRGDLHLYSTNVLNRGFLRSGNLGYIKIESTNAAGRVNLAGTGLQTGGNPLLEATHHGRNMANARYTNDAGISDLYWGIGTNNSLAGGPQMFTVDLAASFSGFAAASPHTPTNPAQPQTIQVVGQLTAATNRHALPVCGGPNFSAFQQTTILGAGANGSRTSVVQVVLVNTNAAFPNLQVQVGFVSSNVVVGSGGWTSIVQFALSDVSIADDAPVTSYLYLLDSALSAGGASYYQNQVGNATMRPRNFELIRAGDLSLASTPAEWLAALPAVPTTDTANLDFFLSSPPPGALVGALGRPLRVDAAYSSYAAWLSPTNYPWNQNPAAADPTNYPGKVQIFANNLNAVGTRIRSENFVGIEAKNLEGNPAGGNPIPQLPQIDAPFVNLDIGTTQPVLVISNAFPSLATVNRFHGQLAAYSAVWNLITTNLVVIPGVSTNTNYFATEYHVLLVDNCLNPEPVSLNKFAVHAGHLDVQDPLNFDGSMLLDVTSLNIGPLGALSLPDNWSWGATNVPRLRSLTNNGYIGIPREGNFWLTNTVFTTNVVAGRTTITTNLVEEPYENVVNHGGISAAKIEVRTEYLENSNTPFTTSGGIVSTNGILSLSARDAVFNNGRAVANGWLFLNALNLDIRSSTLWAGTNNASGGGLFIAVTNRLDDGGTNANNEWHVRSQGFQVVRRPASGDLLGTRVYSTLPPRSSAQHVWPARDLGATTNGFTNNLALGMLVLDGANTNTFFQFRGPDYAGPYALYVDYLDLRNWATNYRSSLQIETNFTIYFANSSANTRKLMALHPGRMVWVYTYTGLYSSTNLTFGQFSSYAGWVTNTYTFNTALVQSRDIDSDRDHLYNFEDPSPIFTAADIDLVIAQTTNGTPSVTSSVLTWTALAYATNVVECATDSASRVWQQVTNFVQGPVTGRVTITNDTAGAVLRVYRVREDHLDYLLNP